MNSNPDGIWCIRYAKVDDKKNWNVMKLQRKDGVLVSAKTYDEAFKFNDASYGFSLVRSFYEDPEQKYIVEMKRIYRNGNDFYL